jgi:phosphonate transport system ATP-binding protein
VLDTPTRDLGKVEVMEIYGRVASTTASLAAIADELGGDAAAALAGSAAAAASRADGRP